MKEPDPKKQDERVSFLKERLSLYMAIAKDVLDEDGENLVEESTKDRVMMAALILCLEDNLPDIREEIWSLT